MNKTITMFKRMGAVLLCLAMLCGVIMGVVVLPTMAEDVSAPSTDGVKTFNADFADLAELVDESKYDDASGLYTSTESDTAINEWINARFGVFVNRENSCYKEKAFLGQGSFKVVNFEYNFTDTFGEINLQIDRAGALRQHIAKVEGDQQLRKGHALTVKNRYGDYAELANFEAEVVFNTANSAHKTGAVFVSFHEKEPGKMWRSNSTFCVTSGNEAVIVGSATLIHPNQTASADGIIVGNVANTSTKTGYTSFGRLLENGVDYKLTVKVVGTALTAKVTKVSDGSEVYSGAKTLAAAGSGSLSVGMANSTRALKSVKVTELDENGEPVDFGRKPAVKDFVWTLTGKAWYKGRYYTDRTTNTNQTYYNFADQTTESAKAIIAALNKQFDNVYNCEGTVKDSEFGKRISYAGQTGNYVYFRSAFNDKWLQLKSEPTGAQAMRHISSLVPKGSDGKRFYFQNFQTTFEVRLDTVNADPTLAATAVFGFRQQEAGKFTAGYFNVNKEQGLIAISSHGYNFAGGSQIFSGRDRNHQPVAGDMYDAVQTPFTTPIAKSSILEISVKAVGDQVALKIVNKGTAGFGNTTIVNETRTIPYREPGYLAYGMGNKNSDIGNIKLTHLDENGNPISLYEQTAAESAKHRQISFSGIPGAEYVSGKYATGVNYANFADLGETALAQVKGDVQMIYNDGATRINRDAVFSDKGNWLLFYNRWLQLSKAPTGGAHRFTNINAVVPLDDNGIRQALPDSRVKFDFRIEGNTKTILVGVRQNVPGMFMTGENELNKDQVLIAITKKTIRVAGGNDIRYEDFAIANNAEYADDAYGDTFAKELPTQISVEVKAFGNKIEVIIRDLDNKLEWLYAGTFTTNYVRSGYTAIATANGGGNVGAITLSQLSGNGTYEDYPTTTSIPACDWDTRATRFDELMFQDETVIKSIEKLSALYDFSFHGGNYVAKENLTDHWELDSNGILNRRNALGTNATENFAAMTVKKNATEKETFDFFDAIFSVNLDDTQKSTFWVVGGQTDAATIGQVVKTSGGTDYYNDRFAVGFEVGGKVTFLLGDGEPVVIPGFTAGTPTGAYNLRVRVYGNTIEAYLNGTLRAKRTVSANAMKKGMLSFGFAGQEGSVEGVTITRLNKNGATVNYNPVVTEVETFEDPIAVPVYGNLYDQTLPTTVKVLINGVWEDSDVYWDPDSMDFTTVGEGYVTGYLRRTNDVRTEHKVYAGTHNRNNTVSYPFDSADELTDFESWYVPVTGMPDAPAIHTEGTADDNWYIKDGELRYNTNSLYKGKSKQDEFKNGVTFSDYSDFVYKDEVNASPFWSADFGVLVLKTQDYNNFILDVDMSSNAYWGFVGFGAKDPHDAKSVFSSQANGGYSFHIEHGKEEGGVSRATAKLRGYAPAAGDEAASVKTLASAEFPDYAYKEYNHIKVVVSDGVAMLYVNHSGTPDLTYDLPDTYKGGYIYLAFNQASFEGKFNAYNDLKITDLDAGKITATKIVSGAEDIKLNRENGDEFNSPQREIVVADAKGYEYSVCTNWVTTDYRSDVENGGTGTSGTYTIDTSKTWHNIDLSGLANAKYTVESTIGKAYNTNNTKKYYFESDLELDAFESWYLPSTNGVDIAAIHTDGTANDNWIIKNGALTYKKNSWYASSTQMAEGITINGVAYKDERSYSSYASNHAIAVLKADTYKNFILDVDVYSAGRWVPIGFGLQNFDKADGVFAIQKNGANAFVVEHGDPFSNVRLWDYVPAQGDEEATHKYLKSDTCIGYTHDAANHIRIVVSNGEAMVFVNHSATPAITYTLPASYNGGYIYFSQNAEGNYLDNLQITDLDAGTITLTNEIVSGAEDVEIKREDGEEFNLTSLYVKDVEGYTYEITAPWTDDGYHSGKEGSYTFTIDVSKPWYNFDWSALEGSTDFTVTNTIGKAFNQKNTVKYFFESAKELEDFESWYMPTTRDADLPALHTEGKGDDNWVVKHNRLMYKANSMYTSTNVEFPDGTQGYDIKVDVTKYPEAKDANGKAIVYQDNRGYQGYASNHAIAVLNTREYTNFILDVDVRANGFWTPIGFGLDGYQDPMGVYSTQKNGGYSFHVEHGASFSTARLWTYVPGENGAKGTSQNIKSERVEGTFETSKNNHIRVVVSNKKAMLYINHSGVPTITYDLPSSYDGGFIYLALNREGMAYDNLQIIDLDAEEKIKIEEFEKPNDVLKDVTLNRKKGNELSLVTEVTGVDAEGYKYQVPISWKNKDNAYRSWKEGTYTFTTWAPELSWKNVDISNLLGRDKTVVNDIDEDFDVATSRKYYFDHSNDLLDFSMQYSQHGYDYRKVDDEGKETGEKEYHKDYHSMYSGVLVPNDKAFKVMNNKVTNTASATGMGSGWSALQSLRGVATAVLKEVNFYNFRLEFDFTHSGMWYTYALIGVQDPTSAHAEADWTQKGKDFYNFATTIDRKTGELKYKATDIARIWRTGQKGGAWFYTEQEGCINMTGDVSGKSIRYTTTPDGKVYDGTEEKTLYDNTKKHHMSITVVDGLVTFEIDNNGYLYYASLNETALGGFVGFGNHQNNTDVDNFQITALDVNGEPLDWADAVEGEDKGMAPDPIPDDYLGWKPKDDFVWGDEYED